MADPVAVEHLCSYYLFPATEQRAGRRYVVVPLLESLPLAVNMSYVDVLLVYNKPGRHKS